MSGKGNCYDNATMESFWSSYKTEWVYAQPEYATRADATAAAFSYIEVFYNRERLHSSLGYQSPVDFEKQNNYLLISALHGCPQKSAIPLREAIEYLSRVGVEDVRTVAMHEHTRVVMVIVSIAVV
ncbi:MAG: Integrase catalytic region [Chthoniobacteraceae bacterium]|nr:Integrase catalytic region [Chthoniobacteraceae bacterium]